MDELYADRSSLESLTTNELIKLADTHGIEIPPGLDRAIIIEELLEALSETEGGENTKAPVPLVERRQMASAPLPRQYNITFIEVLLRDPLWAFAFWEINAHDKEINEKAPDFGGYCLRVVPVTAAGKVPSTLPSESSFTIPVGPGDSAWYLGFPPEGGSFTVELCVMRGSGSYVLAVSRLFRLPKLPEIRYRESPAPLPLQRLSGIDDFPILRNTQRLSRLPKHSNAKGQ
ncbi:conserved hypothetical protein [Treponema primitia ZAS-2]|uniref:Rho termination factor N-terminal domain-containing protein n=1 Tax=Treponema primitia (strain ATCC BAA-887 / DSM 12427 / ZAS-2) TaxID=545694 RepID=F5YPD0_TREPZ|nr:DUF4912 domain-containing protein [Treponema primitia]AEF85246.1 conserved hypothetical protein [Treponema primitia ZAS-2]